MHSSAIKSKGTFKVQVFDANMNERTNNQGNMLLDSWLLMMNSHDSSPLSSMACVVGSGTSAVTASDTSLQSPLAAKYPHDIRDPKYGYRSGDNVIYELKHVFRFAAGAVVGNISEVGLANMGNSNPSQPIVTRALIRDSSGNPTTISVSASEQLVVTHTLKITVPFTVDAVSSVEFKTGEFTTITGRFGNSYLNTFDDFALNFNTGYSWMSFRTGAGVVFGVAGDNTSGGVERGGFYNVSTTKSTLPNYGGINYKVTFPVDTANYSDIHTLQLPIGPNGVGYKWLFEPALSKTSNDIMELNFVRKFERDES